MAKWVDGVWTGSWGKKPLFSVTVVIFLILWPPSCGCLFNSTSLVPKIVYAKTGYSVLS